jgi:hypothetical protein
MSPIRGVDILLVGDQGDELLRASAAACHSRAARHALLSPLDFCRLVTVHNHDGVPSVSPDLPLILRQAFREWPTSREDQFLRLEEHAHLWAALRLMRSPVVNRPTIEGMHSSNTQSAQAKLLRLAMLYPDLVPAEAYASVNGFDRGTYEVASLTKFIQGDEIDSGSTQTYRGRKRLPPGWLYLQTIFCGESVWVKHDSYGNLDWLRLHTRTIAEDLGLHLGVIYWRAQPLRGRAEVARVVPYPSALLLGGYLGQVVESLLDLCLT